MAGARRSVDAATAGAPSGGGRCYTPAVLAQRVRPANQEVSDRACRRIGRPVRRPSDQPRRSAEAAERRRSRASRSPAALGLGRPSARSIVAALSPGVADPSSTVTR